MILLFKNAINGGLVLFNLILIILLSVFSWDFIRRTINLQRDY